MSDPYQVRSIGEILNESVTTQPQKALVSSLPEKTGLAPPMNPFATLCLGCGHALVESNCIQHGSGGDYTYFPGSDPPGYWHRKCLEQAMIQYKRELEEYNRQQGGTSDRELMQATRNGPP